MIKNLEDYGVNALVLTSQEEQIETPFYTTMITEIKIKPDMFHKIWPGFYPRKELTNQIGAGMGIDFMPTVRIDNVYGDEIKRPDGTIVSPITGIRCFKQGRKMRPDGSFQLSDPQPYEFNWIDRAELDFIADQENGGKKYGSELAKRKHTLELKKFATQRAGTGAELAVIRNLTGMATSFKDADIKKGLIVVSQIIKSTEHVAIEARAKVENIRNGGKLADNINQNAGLLTGNIPDVQGDFDNHFTRPEGNKIAPDKKPEQPPQKKQGFHGDFKENPKTPDTQTPPKPELPKEEYERFMFEKDVSPEWREHFTPILEQQKYSKESVDWAIAEMMGKMQ